LPAGLNVSPVADIPRPAPPPLSRPAADSAAASSMPWQKQLEKVTKEKELPAGNIPFQQPKQTPVPPKPAAPVPPPPHAPPRPAPADSVSGSATAPGVRPVLENLANVGALTLAAMRAMDPADLLIRLQQLAKMEGYFNVLSYLEDSALYKSYIDTGKQALTNRNLFAQDGAHLMTKKEFETFTDVLRKIQVN